MKFNKYISTLSVVLMCWIQALPETRLPQLPEGMTIPEDRAAYIMLHIWDFPENLASTEIAEQALSDFLSVAAAGIAPANAYAVAVDTLTAKAVEAGIDIFSLAAKYTSDPDAPFFDDELYLPFINAVLATPVFLAKNPGLEEHLLYDRECILKNRVGTKAATFIIESTTVDNFEINTLYQSPLNLLILFDPDCSHCRETLTELSISHSLAKAVSDKRVNVIAVWVDAPDSPTSLSLPTAAGWHVVSDRTGIMDKDLYDLPIMPTIYVVDDKGIVIRKNLVGLQKILTALELTD